MGLYQNIDLEQIPTGFFINRAVNFIDPQKHTGRLDTDDTASFGTLSSLHTALLMAEINEESLLKETTETLQNLMTEYGNDNTIPISMLHINYNYIKEDAYEKETLLFNGGDSSIYMGGNTGESAFAEDNLFIAAPLITEIEQGVYNFVLPSELLMSNTGIGIDYIRLKFDKMEGEFYTTPDNAVSINLSQLSGEDYLVIKVCFTNGKCLYARILFNVYAKTIPDNYTSIRQTVTIPANGNHGGATLTIIPACGKLLTKPLIIAEPFNPNNEYNFEKTWEDLTINEEVVANIRDFEAQGYDIVYIDYTNGGDHIERNASLFKDVIAYVNNLKHNNGSTEPNAVLGIDMGALIARLGLKQMENNNVDHETDLYVSLDGPHQGAYIPQSLTQMLIHFQNLAQRKISIPKRRGFLNWTTKDIYWFFMPYEAQKLITTFSCPAAKQLFIGNALDGNFQNNSLGVITGGMNRDFYAMYTAIGSLQHCREIALTNGSLVQKNQQYAAGYGFMGDNMLILSLEDNQFGFVPLIHNVSFDFKLKGMTNRNAGVKYYKGRIDLEVFIGLPWLLKINATNYDIETLDENTLAYDNAPGGYIELSEYVNPKELQKSLGGTGSLSIDRFCIVPTTSSLGIVTDNLRYNVYGDVTEIPITIPNLQDINNPTVLGTYYRADYSDPLFKNFTGPESSNAVGNFWNEKHGFPTEKSVFALGYELLGPTKVVPTAIDLVIGLAPYLYQELWWLPLAEQLYYNGVYAGQFLQPALNYGFKRISPTDNKMQNSGNVIHRNIRFTYHVFLNINTDFPILAPNILELSDLNSPIRPVDEYFFQSDNNSSFWVSTSGQGCGAAPISVTIGELSQMELGAATTGKSGVLNINNHGTVKFEPYSRLVLHNDSRIIVRKGSKLEIGENVDIVLEDPNCVIEIEPGGILEVKGDGLLNYDGDGFVRFIGGDGSSSDDINIIGELEIIGHGNTHKVLELKQRNASTKNINIPSACTRFKVHNGKIVSNCIMDIDAYAEFTYNKVEGGFYYFNYHVLSEASNWDDVEINCFGNTGNTEFKGGTINGIMRATNINQSSNQFILNGITFNKFETEGLKVYNSWTSINNTSFFDNDYPMQFNAMASYTTLKNVTVNNSSPYSLPLSGGKGIKYVGATGGGLQLERCNILNQQTSALIVENAPVLISCSKVKTVSYQSPGFPCVYLTNSASLIMDPSLVQDGGKSYLSGYRITIYSALAEDIQVNYAYSNLDCVGDAFEGTLTRNYTPGYGDFYANNNYWKWGGPPDRINHYYAFYYNGGQFGMSGQAIVNVSSYLSAPPNLTNLCPLDNEGGGGQAKRSDYEMTNPVILKGEAVKLKSGHSLEAAATMVFEPSSTNNSLKERIEKCADIITQSYNDTAIAEPIVSLVYQKMQLSLGEAMKKGFVLYGQESHEAKLLLDAQDYLLSNNNLNEEKRFSILMDRVLTYRTLGKLNIALKELALIQVSDTKHLNYTNKWLCLLTNEKNLQEGKITNKEFAELVALCDQKDELIFPHFNQQEENESRSPLLDGISVFPNPATTQIKISWTSGYEPNYVRMFNIEGKEVYSSAINLTANELTIPTNEFICGVYFIKFDSKKPIDTQKVVIVK